MDKRYRPRRLHSQKYFYKYMSVESAIQILNSQCILCRSPLKFNDPFDMQIGFHYGFNIAELVNEVINKIKALVEIDDEPTFSTENEWNKIVIQIRRKIIPFNEYLLRELTTDLFNKHFNSFEQNREIYRQQRLIDIESIRVLCLAEEFNNLLMWSHYADFHKGIVLRLAVSDKESDDDPLWIVEKVRYQKIPPPLLSLEQMINLVFGIKDINGDELTKQMSLTKSTIWEYENEWRIWTTLEDGIDKDYYMQFNKEKFDGIYFGCKCPIEHKNELIRVGRSINNNIKFYKSEMHESEYKLEFDQIDA